MEMILVLPLLVGFFVTLFFLPFWIRKAKQIGLIWEDMHKKECRKNVAGSGGVGVLLGFVGGVLSYIAIKTFILKTDTTTIEIFALLSSVLIIGFVGFTDDLFGWRKGGLSRKSRIILVLSAAVPLMVINAGTSKMIGIEFGLIYPLFFIPLGIVATTTTFNFLAGYNGLESSQGIIILSALSIATWLNGKSWLSLILLIMASCLCAFYIFNKHPARVFPGDALTYPVGALIAITAILGNIEKIAVFFFIPYILEVGLKVRGKLKKESFAELDENGGLEIPYKKFYGIEHLSIYLLKKIKKGGKVSEKEVVYLINIFQIAIILLGFVLFKGGLVG